MKKSTMIFILLLLVVVIFVVGCSTQGSYPAPSGPIGGGC
jgi:outer membrane lipoprotein-sorting protein